MKTLLDRTEPHQPTNHHLLRHILTAMGSCLLLTISLCVMQLVAVQRLPEGEAYVLIPTGWWWIGSNWQAVVIIGGFSGVYGVVAYAVRPWIRIIYRILLFWLFVLFLWNVQASFSVAVVEDGSTVHFIFPWPKDTVTIPVEQVYGVELRQTNSVYAMDLSLARPRAPGVPRRIRCLPVASGDRQRREVLLKLRQVLQRHP